MDDEWINNNICDDIVMSDDYGLLLIAYCSLLMFRVVAAYLDGLGIQQKKSFIIR